MLRFPFPVFALLVALLLVAGRGRAQAVPEALAQVLHQYQPPRLVPAGASVALGTRGTVQLPPQATQQRTGTKDSDRGEIRLPGLLITYDIGHSAGTHVSALNRGGDTFPWGNPTPFGAYEERAGDIWRATLGLRPRPDGTEVVATLLAPAPSATLPDVSFPANFWADVRTEAELRQFLAVVSSYRPTRP